MDSHLQRLQDEVTAAVNLMSANDLVGPSNGKWSAAEVFEHLYLTYTATVKGLNRCLEQGKPLAGSPTFNDRMKAAIVTRLNYMPKGAKGAARLMPRGQPAEEIAKNIGVQISVMDDAFTQCEMRFGKRARILDHPILGPLTAHEWRKFHLVHGRHHLKQVKRLRGE